MQSSSNLVEIPRQAAPEKAAGVIEMLVELLAQVRRGEIRSVMVASRSADGLGINTQWDCAEGDTLEILQEALKHDIFAARS